MTHKYNRTWIGLAAAAVAINAILVFIAIPAMSTLLKPLYNQDHFVDGYEMLATNLAQGHGYRFYPDTALTLLREPGYPLVLAGIFRAFGDSFIVVKLLNFVAVLLTAWVLILIARRLSANPAAGILSASLFLVNPGTIIAETRGGVESLFTFLIALFVLVIYRTVEKNRNWDYAIAGGLLGLAVLVKSTPLLFPALLFIYMFVTRGRDLRLAVAGKFCLLMGAMAFVLSPWIIRNYLLTQRFVPTASVLGVSAHAGQYICSHMGEDKNWVLLDHEAAQERGRLANELGLPFEGPYYQVFYRTADEITFSSFLTNRVVGEYKRSPWLCVKCMSYNLVNFWCAGKTWLSRSIDIVAQLPYLLLAVWGCIVSIRAGRSKFVWPVVLFIFYSAAVTVPILAQARYSIPLVPLLSVLAAVAVFAMKRKSADCNSDDQAMVETCVSVGSGR